jgi:hypothetical protein
VVVAREGRSVPINDPKTARLFRHYRAEGRCDFDLSFSNLQDALHRDATAGLESKPTTWPTRP